MAMVEQLRESITKLVKENYSEFKPVWGKLIGAGALIFLVALPVILLEVGLMCVGQIGAANSHEVGPLFWVVLPIVIVLHIAFVICTIGLQLGFGKICLKLARKESISLIADLKSGLKLIVPTLLTGLIVAPAVILGMACLLVPGIYLALRLSFINVAIADGLGPIDAIKKSFSISNHHVLEILALIVLAQVSYFVVGFIPLVNLFGLLFFFLPFVHFFWAKYYVSLEAR